MPSMDCANCGHRIFLPTSSTTCPNCSIDIMPFPASGSSKPAVPMISTPSPRGIGISGSGSTGSSGGAPKGPAFPLSGLGPSMGTGSSVMASPVQRTYVTKMPSRIPELEGTIIGVQNLQEVESSEKPNWVFMLGKQVWDIAWPVYDPRYGGHREWRTTITSLRIQAADGSQREARLRGDIKRGSATLGDLVVLWGRMSKGTLLVQRAYNLTSNAEIKLKGDDLTWVGAIIVMTIAMVIVLSMALIFHVRAFPPLP